MERKYRSYVPLSSTDIHHHAVEKYKLLQEVKGVQLDKKSSEGEHPFSEQI